MNDKDPISPTLKWWLYGFAIQVAGYFGIMLMGICSVGSSFENTSGFSPILALFILTLVLIAAGAILATAVVSVSRELEPANKTFAIVGSTLLSVFLGIAFWVAIMCLLVPRGMIMD